MATQTPIYTGERAGIGMVRGGGEKTAQALDKYHQTLLEAEKFKYGERKKEEADFLERIKTKPEFVLSDKARERQAKAIENYNNKYAPLISKGYLTMEEKTAMAREKAALEAMQQEQIAHYQRWEQINQAVNNNPFQYDSEEWEQATKDYMESGVLKLNRPPLKPANVTDYLRKMSSSIKNKYALTPKVETRDGFSMVTEGTTNIRPDDMPSFIETSLLSATEDVLKGVVSDFNKANPSPQDKAKWLVDTDKSGDVGTEERKNGIIEWAKDYYSQKDIAVTTYDTQTRNKPRASTTASTPKYNVGGASVSLSAGAQTPGVEKKFRIEPAPGEEYSDSKEYSQSQSFQFGDNTVLYGINTPYGVIDGMLRLYDPVKKVFVLEVKRGASESDAEAGDLIEVPENNIVNFGNIPLNYGGGTLSISEYKQKMQDALDNYQPVRPEGVSKGRPY